MGTQRGGDPGPAKTPLCPTDMFAAVASLVQRCELYRCIMPEAGVAAGSSPTRQLIISSAERENWIAWGAAWRKGPNVEPEDADPDDTGPEDAAGVDDHRDPEGIGGVDYDDAMNQINALWGKLLRDSNSPIHAQPSTGECAWWRTAIALLVISDEACIDLGFSSVGEPHWLEALLRQPAFKDEAWEDAEGDSNGSSEEQAEADLKVSSRHALRAATMDTFCVYASPYVARVVPKARVPGVGCTMRTLSHNLALLEPRDAAAINWLRQPGAAREDDKPLNILIVPFPHRVEATCFESHLRGDGNEAPPWGFFEIKQRWLSSSRGDEPTDEDRRAVVDFIMALVETAARDVGAIGALVLPEGALDWPTYVLLVDTISKSTHPVAGLEFLISGSSGFKDRPNNYVLTTSFLADKDGAFAVTTAQAKHHRWRLEENQIRGYALASALDPAGAWWENIEIDARRVGLNVFRAGSTFAAMICEDLARSEPCHAALRAVGPNLVFVLLMDGPQLPQRWAAQYSTVLADDPGSSVLTLTSKGLVRRANEVRRASTHAVALWKDDKNGLIQLECPPDVQGLTLTLSGRETGEATLDGRYNTNAISWHYHGHQNVRLDADARRKFAWLLE
ncbi:hypothetical protein GCM10011322_41850 [Salinarimonas ramus]|uniref:Uncharacterized protein n=2 Tax=Salinarimonas ramus TaxID=690164 RepID=A0A917QHD3_9HYPH|nr:hypothetical protein GCM10011322_41850 [Salinarimonas ramus]